MGKISSGQNIAGQVPRQTLHKTKNNSIKKDKKSKFKSTPTDKVALIGNIKELNKNMSPQKKFQKNTNAKNNQHSSKERFNQLEGKENSPKEKQNSSKGKRNLPLAKQAPKGKQIPNKLQNKRYNKKISLPQKQELDEVDDSDSDIDEGIIPQEEISMIDDKFKDEEESDSDVPDIFGASLAEESDVDDEDFEDEEEDEKEQKKNEEFEDSEDEDSEEEAYDSEDDDDINVNDKKKTVVQGGINMFKGIKSNGKNKDLEVSNDEDDDDDDDDEDDDDDDEELEEGEDDSDNENEEDIDTSNVDTSMLESDEDDEEVEDEEEDEDVEDEEEEEDEDEDEEEEEEEDEDDEEEEEEEEENKNVLGLKALLGKSMTDDDDDEDFNEEDEDDEDDDISDEEESDEDHDDSTKITQKKIAKEKATATSNPEEQEEVDKRTIFVDNIPKDTKEGALKKVFGRYGPIDNLRFRSIIPKNPKTPKKVAAIKKDIHPKVTTVVVYINYKAEESAKKALCMNGQKFEGNYMNVKIVANRGKHDIKKSVFIGNLKFGITTNPIWECFGKCGEVDSVHLVRDKKTGQTKGFGYVNFKSPDSVPLALKLEGVEIENRPVRVYPCKETPGKPQKQSRRGKKRSFSNESNDSNSPKKFKKNSQKVVTHPTKNETKIKQKKVQENASSEAKPSKSFQGQKVDMKNKKKESKFDKKKKEMAGKLAAKPKKQKA